VIIPFGSEAQLILFSCSSFSNTSSFSVEFPALACLDCLLMRFLFRSVLRRWAKCSPLFGSSRWLHWARSPAQFFLHRFVFPNIEGILSALFSVCMPFSPGQELMRPRFDFSGCFLDCLHQACLRVKLPSGRSWSGPALVFSPTQATLIGVDLSLCVLFLLCTYHPVFCPHCEQKFSFH
jgi:hypothetical protein